MDTSHAEALRLIELAVRRLQGRWRIRGSDGPDAHASPDRADALVWALTALLITPASHPRIRAL